MLDRFLDKPGFLPIPFTSQYLVDSDGAVIDLRTGPVVTDVVNDEKYVTLDEGIRIRIKTSVLAALAFKSNRISFRVWNKLDVIRLDENLGDRVSNLVWRYKEPIHMGGGFYAIPGFYRYWINRQGMVHSVAVNRCISPYCDEMGYWMYGVTPDIGKRTIVGMHRLLALTFLPYPAYVDKCDVNHKDGNKANNKLENLEWVNRKGNCDHAYSTGLRDDNIPVLSKNAFTGVVEKHYSLEECARRVGCDGETVRLRIRSSGQVLYPPGIQFKRADDVTPWKVFEDPTKALLRAGVAAPIHVLHKQSGRSDVYTSISEAAKALGLTISGLSYRLRNKDNRYVDDQFVIQKQLSVKSPP